MDDIVSDDRVFAQPTVAHGSGDASSRPLLWILTGNRRGDNNQLFALADALELPFEAKQMTYNGLRHIPFLRGPRLVHVTREARRQLTPPWPSLVIGVSCNSAPVARYVRRRSGGRARLVQIGDPRTPIEDLDLVITTPQFSRREGPNVLALPFPIGNPAQSARATGSEDLWLRGFPKPLRLVAVGGPTRKWKLDNSELDRAIRHLQHQCASDGGSVIAVTSPRTTQRTRRVLESRLTGETEAVVDDFPRFAVLLARCDECYVTADSVSMLSEAVLTGKPVGMIPIARTLKGRIGHWLHRLGMPHRGDMSKFWRYLAMNNLVGSVASPVASNVNDTVSVAAKAVRRILAHPSKVHPS